MTAPHKKQHNPADSFPQPGAGMVLTEPGGVQEEACIPGVQCVTLRDNAERPKTVEVGANMLTGTEPERMASCARSMMDRDRDWENPFGDGKAGERIRRVMTMGMKLYN